MMDKRKYPPGPEIETIERLMKRRDDLREENKELRNLLKRLYNVSIGILSMDDGALSDTWLERMKYAKKVMDEVQEELTKESGDE